MSKPMLAVDWDGTCVEHVWPAEGDWLPGAREALATLVPYFDITIHTCRIAPVYFGSLDQDRPVGDVFREVAYIRRMLDEANLRVVTIWQRNFKPPAVAYIDDKGIHYRGRKDSWMNLLPKIFATVGLNYDPEEGSVV